MPLTKDHQSQGWEALGAHCAVRFFFFFLASSAACSNRVHVVHVRTYPTSNGGMQKWEAPSEHVRVALHVLAHFGRAELHAQSMLVNKKFPASELGREVHQE